MAEHGTVRCRSYVICLHGSVIATRSGIIRQAGCASVSGSRAKGLLSRMLRAIEPAGWGTAPPPAHFATKSANCCLGHSVMVARSQSGGEDTMRTYVTVTGVAVGLLAVWAALAPFVS
jgi:hypothetical protein